MKRYIFNLLTFLTLINVFSCKRYLDVAPDNIATIDKAFALRAQAEKYLATCYSYLPQESNSMYNPAMTGGDEIWPLDNFVLDYPGNVYNIAIGRQNIVTPFPNGGHNLMPNNLWSRMYMAIRDCNIFLDNIRVVPDMARQEKAYWVAEVKFLKAFYYFQLIRHYGPVPLVKENLPVDAPTSETQIQRDPLDSCYNYVTQLLDEAKDSLPDQITDVSQYGRINRPIAYSLKAKVLVFAASPLFNGNSDQANLKNLDGTQLFDQTYRPEKWQKAANACKEAIDLCHSLGYKLYVSDAVIKSNTVSKAIQTQLSIRNSFAEAWNPEVIWSNVKNDWAGVGWFNLQQLATTRWDPNRTDNATASVNILNAPLKIAEMFYTKNGLPINQDKTWDMNARYSLRMATNNSYKLFLKLFYTTVGLHFDREPRFYADLGFDGGIWYGQGRYNENSDLFWIQGKVGQINGKFAPSMGPVTGYNIKKLINYQNEIQDNNVYTQIAYPWPAIKLSDLYLMYAEALNESDGSKAEALDYINRVRTRADIPSVQNSWDNFSTSPGKYNTKDGFREIIQRETLIELAFEGKRFYDLRRWKTAIDELNNPIKGWDITQSATAAYYRPVTIFDQKFTTRDYFIPISESEMTRNKKLVQNTGWQ